MKCRKILIVDDDHDSRGALAQKLMASSYLVEVADNGKEALEWLFTEELPDVILLDLDMPVMNGWEFLQIQKTATRIAHIPTLVYSSRHEVYEHYSGPFLSKVSSFDELLESLGRICSKNGEDMSEQEASPRDPSSDGKCQQLNFGFNA